MPIRINVGQQQSVGINVSEQQSTGIRAGDVEYIKGDDGVSPIIEIEAITGGTKVTIIDAEHPQGQIIYVMNGEQGEQGFSPTVEIQTIQGGHRVIITDEDGPHSFDVIDYLEGRAISSTVLNEDYTLTIFYTDGTSYTTPSIRGPQGPAVPLSDATPLMDDTASAGTGTSAARSDHRHPTDTSRVDKTGDTMTGQLNVGGPSGVSSVGTIQIQGGSKTFIPTSGTIYAANLRLSDANNNAFGFLRSYQDSDGRVGVILYGLNAGATSISALRLLFDGSNQVVEVTSPPAWRSALGLVATEESMTLSPAAQKTYSLVNSEHGIIIASGSLEATRGLIIYNVSSGGVVSYTMLGNASSVAVTTGANSITIKNNANVLFSLFKMTW